MILKVQDPKNLSKIKNIELDHFSQKIWEISTPNMILKLKNYPKKLKKNSQEIPQIFQIYKLNVKNLEVRE